ncbi:MAG: hypothetical protein MJ016_04200 [Victivallaceae bacterium]|nr:hypothetical protein [Victivallaceae bacterium]
MKNIVFLGGVAAVALLAGCATEDSLVVYSRNASKVLERRVSSEDGAVRIRAAEADPMVGRTDFPLREKTPSGHVGELRVRIGGAIAEIRRLALNPQASGHLPALESSAILQLHYSIKERQILWAIVHAGLHGKNEAIWLLAVNGDPEAEKLIDQALAKGASGELDQLLKAATDTELGLVASDQVEEVVFAARTAGFLESLPAQRQENLKKIVQNHPFTRCGATAQWALARHQAASPTELRVMIEKNGRFLPEEALSYYVLALGEVGGESDLPLLEKYLYGDQPDVSTAAGGAILQICRRLLPFRERN